MVLNEEKIEVSFNGYYINADQNLECTVTDGNHFVAKRLIGGWSPHVSLLVKRTDDEPWFYVPKGKTLTMDNLGNFAYAHDAIMLVDDTWTNDSSQTAGNGVLVGNYGTSGNKKLTYTNNSERDVPCVAVYIKIGANGSAAGRTITRDINLYINGRSIIKHD